MGRGSPSCLLLALPEILQPHSSSHLPGPENHLDFPTDVWQPSTQTQKSGLNGNVSLFDGEDFTKVLFIYFLYITEKANYISWKTQTGLVACLSAPNEMERPVGKISMGSGP